MTIETTELRPSNDTAPSPQYPSAEELFAGIKEPNPHLIAAYNAYTSTSALRKRDPSILSELVFGEEIRTGTITRRDASRAFRGLTDQLSPLLRAAGLNVVREKRSRKDELVHLGKLDPNPIVASAPTSQMNLRTEKPKPSSQQNLDTESPAIQRKESAQQYEETAFAGIEFPEGSSFPTAEEVNSAILKRIGDGTYQRRIADRVLVDYIDGRPTRKSKIFDAIFPGHPATKANSLLSAHRNFINHKLEPDQIAIARIEPITTRGDTEYTYVRSESFDEIPVGRRIGRRPAAKEPTSSPKDSPRKKEPKPNTDKTLKNKVPTGEYLAFPDPDKKEIGITDVELSPTVRFATEKELQMVEAHFNEASRFGAITKYISDAARRGQLGFIRSGALAAYPDMEVRKGLMNFATGIIGINISLENTRIRITSMRIPARRGESGMFYALIAAPQDTHLDLKDLMRLKPEFNPAETKRSAPTITSELLEDTPKQTLTDNNLSSPETYAEPLAQDTSTSAETEDPFEEVSYDVMLDSSEIAMIRVLFGSDEERAIGISDIDRSVFPDKRKGKGHLRGTIAALDRFNKNLLDGSEVQIVEKPSASSIHNREFYLQHPEDWSVNDVLRYLYELRADQQRREQEDRTPSSSPEPNPKPEPIDLEEGIEVVAKDPNKKDLEQTTDTEVALTEGEVAELTIASPTKPLPSETTIENPSDFPEAKRSGLSFSAKNVVTALFGNGDGQAVRLHAVAELFRPGRNVKNDHLQSALLSVGNVKISGDSVVKIVQVASGRLDAYQFRLEYPEGWTLEQILSYLESQSEQKRAENIILAGAVPVSHETRREPRSFVPDVPRPREVPTPVSPAPTTAIENDSDSTTYNEFAKLFQRGKNQEQIPGAPTIKIDLRKMEWNLNGKGGKIPFRELIPVLARLAKSPDGIDRFALAGLKSGDQNQKVIDQASRNFLNIQKALDDPENPQIFTSTGGGRYTTYRMIANIELV